mgnify:CR=1 FL=1
MARKIYKRIGIRRDRNLADLSDTKQGLNSLLDTLIDETGNTFISEDLDVTRNLFAEGINENLPSYLTLLYRFFGWWVSLIGMLTFGYTYVTRLGSQISRLVIQTTYFIGL